MIEITMGGAYFMILRIRHANLLAQAFIERMVVDNGCIVNSGAAADARDGGDMERKWNPQEERWQSVQSVSETSSCEESESLESKSVLDVRMTLTELSDFSGSMVSPWLSIHQEMRNWTPILEKFGATVGSEMMAIADTLESLLDELRELNRGLGMIHLSLEKGKSKK